MINGNVQTGRVWSHDMNTAVLQWTAAHRACGCSGGHSRPPGATVYREYPFQVKSACRVQRSFVCVSCEHSLLCVVCPDNRAKWKNVPVNGDPPSPRTYHTTSACVQDKLYVFSGGEAGASPVSDQKLHVFDTGQRRIHHLFSHLDLQSSCDRKSAFISMDKKKCLFFFFACFFSFCSKKDALF